MPRVLREEKGFLAVLKQELEIAVDSLRDRNSTIIDPDLRYIEAQLKVTVREIDKTINYLKDKIADVEDLRKAVKGGNNGTPRTDQTDQ